MTLYLGAPSRRRRREGDRKRIRGIEHLCQQVIAEGCYLVSDGRPVLEWVPVDQARATLELRAIRARHG
jgi:hypothetical protein